MSDQTVRGSATIGVVREVAGASPVVAAPKDAILRADAAAVHLGITPELLFAYARHAPKKGEKRRLRYVSSLRAPGFERTELDLWNEYLCSPWPTEGERRADVPSYIEDYLKVESGGCCAQCGRGHPLTNAHITPWRDSRSNHHHNLIRLCTDCHTKFDQGMIAYVDICRLKLALVERIRRALRVAAADGGADADSRVPNPDPTFVGRGAQVAWLIERLPRCRFVSVEGVGGIGKTQLLLRALGGLSDVPVVWIDVEGAPSRARIETAIAVGLAQHHLAGAGEPVVDALRDLRVRVVLDGLEHIAPSQWDEVLDLLGILARHTVAPRFVLTTQIEIHGVPIDARLTLGPLPADDGLAVLGRSAGDQAVRDSDMVQIVEFCEGHPLALRLAGALLAYFKSAAEVLSRLRARGSTALAEPTRCVHTPASSLHACLAVAHDSLTDEEKALLRCVAQFPSGCIVEWLTIILRLQDAPLAVAGTRRWHLLETRVGVDGLSRLHLLSPIRSYVQAHARESAPEAVAALRREVIIALATQAAYLDEECLRSADAAWGIARFESDLQNYVEALESAAVEEHAAIAVGIDPTELRSWRVSLTRSLAAYMFSRGLLDLGERILRNGVDASRAIGARQTAAYLLSHLVSFYARRHDVKQMRSTTAELEALGATCDDSEVAALADLAKGDVALREHRYGVAAACFRRTILHFQTPTSRATPSAAGMRAQSGKSAPAERTSANRGMLAVAEWNLGRACLGLGDREGALAALQRSLALNEAIPFPINVATTAHEIGNVLADLGRVGEACMMYQRAATLFTELGAADFISNSLGELGLLLGEGSPHDTGVCLEREILEFGLDDVAQMIRELLSGPPSEWPSGRRAMECLRKFFGVMTLVSASAGAEMLVPWARGLRDEVLRPVMATLPRGRYGAHDLAYLLMPLDIGLAMAGTMGSAEEHRTEAIAGGVIDALGQMAYVLESAGLLWARPFEWIRAWAGRDRDAGFSSVGELRARAERSARPARGRGGR